MQIVVHVDPSIGVKGACIEVSLNFVEHGLNPKKFQHINLAQLLGKMIKMKENNFD